MNGIRAIYSIALATLAACALAGGSKRLQRLEDVLPVPHNDTMAVVIILDNATTDSVEVFVDAGMRAVRVGTVPPRTIEPLAIPGPSMGQSQIVTVSFRRGAAWFHVPVWRIARGPFVVPLSVGHAQQPGTRS